MKIKILFISILLTISACKTEPERIRVNKINEYNSLIKEFRTPGPDYRSTPLWVWNNDVGKEDIDFSLAEFKKQGIEGAFIHPRAGLQTEYLSGEWFELVAYAIEKAKKLGMKIWIYDEYVCPSGFAGGHVYNEMPESYNQGVLLIPHRMERLDLSADFERVKSVFKKNGENWGNITSQANEEEGQQGEYVVFELRNHSVGGGGFAGFSYVDLLVKGVTEKFMDITMSGYEKIAGNEFGNMVPGVFTDEPQIGSGGDGIRYTPDLFDEFRKRWGYSLENELVSLAYETGHWKKVRHDYRSVLLEMFIERWSKPWYAFTEENNLIWTGHYWENTWPDLYHGPDNMAMYAWHQMPGIDMLFNSLELRPDQFGNNVAVKELSSIANQFERHRTLSETYGGAGWDLRFEDMKRLGDWEYALGVNFLNQHLCHLSLVGSRKHDYPQSFMPHAPYWDLYKHQTDYFARLSVALSSGRQINSVLVLEPTTTAWMYYSPITSEAGKRLKEIGDSFKGMVQFLEDQQVEYDLGCENVIRDFGRVSGNNFIVNKRSYHMVIVPDKMENIDRATFELLKSFITSGGSVLQIGEALQMIDGAESDEWDSLTAGKNWIRKDSLDTQVVKEYLLGDTFKITPSSTGRMHHHRRQLKDGQVLFLSNFSLENAADTSVSVEGASVEGMCPQSGETFPVYYEKNGNTINFSVHLPPAGSYLVFVHNKNIVDPAETGREIQKKIVKSEESSIDILYPNVLNLDYVNLSLMGENLGHMYYAKASDLIYKRFGYETGNPWKNVQYKTVFLDKNREHKKGDRFEVRYTFDLASNVDKTNMTLVVERSPLYNITLNGKTVKSGKKTWLDPDFNCIDIADFVKPGRNVVKLAVSRFDNRCEIAPVYILGNFSLKSSESGWEIIPAADFKIGSWKNQGLPFYSESVKYTKQIVIDNSGDYEIELMKWNGTVAEVLVNGKNAGVIQSQPYTKKIGLESGKNEISVVVYGSLKNAFGPHHVIARGFMRPPAFRTGKDIMPKGTDYDVLDYGLMEDFKVYKKVYKKLADTKKQISVLQDEFLKLKFGMFIHYNMATYQGVQWVEGYPDPSEFDPGVDMIDTDAWADAAVAAGMKYAVLTVKHVGGFCLWDSEYTRYDIKHPDCPYQKDLVAQFIKSFKDRGLKVGLYYCWRHPGFDDPHKHKVLPPECDPATHSLEEQISFQKAQIAELITKYPDVFYLWNDALDPEIMAADEILAHIRGIRPDVLTSANWWDWSKKGTPYVDIAVTETRHFPEGNRAPGETCWCLEQKWFWEEGFHSKSAEEIAPHLIKANSRNANFLLNVGPDQNGNITESSIKTLTEIGELWNQK